MNVLELCLSPGLGGLELYVFRCAQALEQQHRVTGVLNTAGKLTAHFSEHTQIRTHKLNPSSKLLPLLNARSLAHIIDDEQIDVIHMHWGNDLALAALAKRFSRTKPALVYTRQMKITRHKNDLYHRFLYAQMDLMLTITRQLEQEAKQFIPVQDQQISTLYYGVKAPRAFLSREDIRQQRDKLGFAEQDFIVGLLGRLERGKGQHLLIEAMALAAQEGLELKAMIIGHEMKQGYRYNLKDLAHSKGLDDNIVFMDFVSEPQQLMQLCDCITLTSFEETFGLVLPEAMRSGVAVVGSNKGGVPEIITHEHTGLLFESGDAASLYKQIRHLYTEPDFRKRLAENGKMEADARFKNDDHFSALKQYLIEASQ